MISRSSIQIRVLNITVNNSYRSIIRRMDGLTRRKLDIETVRGKYTNGEQVLFIDWRLRKDQSYDVSGK